MKHIRSLCCPVQKAAANVGTYISLAGQIIIILSSLFKDKEILLPNAELPSGDSDGLFYRSFTRRATLSSLEVYSKIKVLPQKINTILIRRKRNRAPVVFPDAQGENP